LPLHRDRRLAFSVPQFRSVHFKKCANPSENQAEFAAISSILQEHSTIQHNDCLENNIPRHGLRNRPSWIDRGPLFEVISALSFIGSCRLCPSRLGCEHTNPNGMILLNSRQTPDFRRNAAICLRLLSHFHPNPIVSHHRD
jgi:hypothetical protein